MIFATTAVKPFIYNSNCPHVTIQNWLVAALTAASMADKHGVAAAAAAGPELPGFCSGSCQSCLCPEWILGKGGTSLWTAASGQPTWQLRAGAWRIYNVPVCLSEGRTPQWTNLPVTNQQSDFSLCLVSEGQWRTHTHTHSWWRGDTRTRELVCQSILSSHCTNSTLPLVCVGMRARVRATGKQQGIVSGDRWHTEGARTHQSEEQVLTHRPSRLILPALAQAEACFVSRPPVSSSDPSRKSHPEWQPASIAYFFSPSQPIFLSLFYPIPLLSRRVCSLQVQVKFVPFEKQSTFVAKCSKQEGEACTKIRAHREGTAISSNTMRMKETCLASSLDCVVFELSLHNVQMR